MAASRKKHHSSKRKKVSLRGAVVGVGASAGGLDAFKKLFEAMPPDTGIAFVLIPHLDPTHESLMVELLQRHTAMTVIEAEENMPVEPNSVYVIPPSKYLAIQDGALHLSAPPAPRGHQTAIDFFFRSLAEDRQAKAVGIILSGTGSHGVLGLREIKAAGGLVMAQAPETAEYDQMPRNAIGTGLVDFALPPEEMPESLIRYVDHPYVTRGATHTRAATGAADAAEANEKLGPILAAIRSRSKFDFRCYRKDMLMRRIQRRMGLCRIESLDGYLERLRNDPEEITALYKDLLIGVTSFFREPEAFSVLEQRVIPELAVRVHSDSPMRIWVPACATGEEAYSIAMVAMEALNTLGKPPAVLIFATDIDETSLEVARQGIYPKSIVSDVSQARLERYFTKVDQEHYQVNQQLREACVFAPQNLIADAPFSRLDLVSCRNVLIYLEPDVQQKLISLFHFALNDGGTLLLGSSETIGGAIDSFEPVSKKWRVYRRIGPRRRELVDIPILATGGRRMERVSPTDAAAAPVEVMHRHLLAEHAPAAVLINQRYEVLCFQGPTMDYLELPPGEPTRDLLAMARQGLRTKIRGAVAALQQGAAASTVDARVKRSDHYVRCTVTAKRIREAAHLDGPLLITFQDVEAPRRDDERSDPPEESKLVQQLEHELNTTREDLQSTIEELESSNEEMKASNAEVMSMNEELQSANEELETSKEELQSLNEELSTVNNQLQDKVDQLEEANNDIANLLASTDIATIFLDRELHIKRFTPATTGLFNVMAGDIGRPIRDLAIHRLDEALLGDARLVLEKLVGIDKDVRGPDGRIYSRRIQPYRTGSDRIDGVVVTFVDITTQMNAAADAHWLATVIRDSNDAVTVLDFEGRLTSWNKGAERMYGYSEKEALAMNILDIVPDDKRHETLDFIQLVHKGNDVPSLETTRLTKRGRLLDVWLTATLLKDENGNALAVATTERDITERRHLEGQREERLRSAEHRFESVVNAVTDAILTIDDAGIVETFNAAAEGIFGYRAHEVIGRNIGLLMPEPYRSEHDGYIERFLRTGEARIIGTSRELVAQRKDGTVFPVEVTVSEIAGVRRFAGVVRDLTGEKETKDALERSRGELRLLSARLLSAEEEERRRLSRELHDDFNQRLATLAIDLEALSRGDVAPQVASRLGDLRGRVGELSDDIHGLAYQLHPAILDDLGLPAALRAHIDDFVSHHDFDISFRERSVPSPLPPDVSACLYRISQEALTNIAKHSGSERVSIRLCGTAQSIRLSIRDFGTGFDVASARNHRKSLGIVSMEERVRLVGGAFAIESTFGEGTRIRATLPLPSKSA